MEITKVAPSLVEFLEAVATNDHHYDKPKYMYEAFEVLKNALQVLTDPGRYNSGLSWDLSKVLDDLLANMKTNTEETVNVAIVNHILLHLTKNYCVLNKGHSKVVSFPKRTYLPETFLWDGLGLGK